MLRPRRLVVPLLALVVVAGALGLALLRSGGGDGDDSDGLLAPGGPPPGDVRATAEALNGGAESQREALSPDLVALMDEGGHDGAALPADATVQLDDDGWRSEIDGYGSAEGRVIGADGGSTAVEIGFVREDDGAWRVTYVAEREDVR